MTDIAALSIEERIALLEARLAPNPTVLVPPIVIGSLANVPAPGSQLAAQWAQDVTGLAVHRFATAAARDSAYPPAAAGKGATSTTTDTGTLWLVNESLQWEPIRMGTYGNEFYSKQPTSDTTFPGGSTAVNVFGLNTTLPSQPAAGWVWLSFTAHINQDQPASSGSQMYFHKNGAAAGPVYLIEDRAQNTSHTMTLLTPGVAGAAFSVGVSIIRGSSTGTGTVKVIAGNSTFSIIRYIP